MVNKKTSKSTKTPEKSISDRINHYKGVAKLVKKRMNNLEKRVQILEQQLEKYKLDINEVKYKEKKDLRKDFMDKWIQSGGKIDE